MKLTRVRLLALGLMVALLLSACNMPITPTPHPTPIPTQTPQPPEEASPSAVGSACPVGTWQVNNIAEYLNAALPQMIEGATVNVRDVSGNLSYTFNADGTTNGKAEDFQIKATVTTNGLSLPGQIVVSGSSTGKYQADENQGLLTLTQVSPGDLKVTASVAGVPVVNQSSVTDLFMLGADQTGTGSANFQCIGNTLKISMQFSNTGPRIIVLQRGNPQ
jgi:hypothetical protein